MPQKRYTVRAPDGRTITLEGPEGASPEEVIAQAQRLSGESQPANPLLAAQAAQYPTAAEEGGMPGTAVESKGPSLRGFAENIPASALQFGGDLAHVALHPFETGEGLAQTAVGLISKMTPARFKVAGPLPQEGIIDAIATHYKERYGDRDKAAQALYEDPVGVLADLSTLASGVSGLARAIPKVSAAQKFAEAAGRIGRASDPLRAVTAPAKAVLQKTGAAERLYESALKPGPRSHTAEQVRDMVKTGIADRIPISRQGLEKLWDKVEDLNAKVETRIQAGNQAGITLSPSDVAARTGRTFKEFSEQVTPEADLAQIRGATAEFMRRHSRTVSEPAGTRTREVPTGVLDPQGRMTTRPETETIMREVQQEVPIPILQAQREKQGTYRVLRKKYDKTPAAAPDAASVAAQKALARGIREEIENVFPEIGALNKQESRLLQLEPELEAAVNRIRNSQIVPLTTGMIGGFGIATESKSALAAALLKYVLDSPRVKSRLSFAIDYATKRKGGTPVLTPMARIERYVDELEAVSAELQPAP